MRRAVLGGLAAALLLSLSACGGDDATPDDEPETSSTPTDGLDSDEVAGIVAGTPTDVRWRVPEVPPTWKQLKTDPGEAQWRVGGTCVVSLFQPAGLGKDKEPTQEQVLDEYAKRIGKAVGSTLQVSDRDTSMFPLVTTNQDVAAKTKVSHAALAGGAGVEGQIYAYRSGDFALVLSTVCGKGAFASVHGAELQPFIQRLAITAEY